MSLLAYQQALCEMIAAPELCLRVRADPEAALADHELTTREVRRLAHVAGQRGMSVNCTLHRVNRITPLYVNLPLTCRLLGDEVTLREAERFWREGRPRDLQFGSETFRFAAFLRDRLAELAQPWLADLLALEVAIGELRLGLGGSFRSVDLDRDPEPLLAALTAGERAPPAGPRAGAVTLLVETDGERIALSVLEGGGRRSLTPVAAEPSAGFPAW